MALNLQLTTQERRIIGTAERTSYYQPQQADVATADLLLGRGLLHKADDWDYLETTPAGRDAYYADLDDIKEQRHQHRIGA